LVQREAAQALSETDLIPSEPITVVLSEKGWIRAAKGADVNPRELNYRGDDGYLHSAVGRSNQMLLSIDSTGRTYTMPAHTLPSARGMGEPVSKQLKPPQGAIFKGLMIGSPETQYLLATDAGYGFVAPLGELTSRNKSGKVVLRVFALADLPVMSKGKGVKIINVPSARYKSGEEKLVAVAVFREGDKLRLYSGKQHMKLKPADIDLYLGFRAQRGGNLPRGYRQPTALEIDRGDP
jgi:topoisomerase-4 subunit A